MFVLREPSPGELENCQPPSDYTNLQILVEETRKLGGVITAQELPPQEMRRRCYGQCAICFHTDDCDTPYQNILGNQDFIPGVTIA